MSRKSTFQRYAVRLEFRDLFVRREIHLRCLTNALATSSMTTYCFTDPVVWKGRWALACASLVAVSVCMVLSCRFAAPDVSSIKRVWRHHALQPYHQGLLTLSVENGTEKNQLLYKRRFATPFEDGMLLFTASPGRICGTPYVYDICAWSENYASYSGAPDFSTDQCYYEQTTFDGPLWNDGDPMVQSLHEGNFPTLIWSHRFGSLYNNSRYGEYYILQRGDFLRDNDFMTSLKAYVNSWPADFGDDENETHVTVQ
jgi:hypothetical protein